MNRPVVVGSMNPVKAQAVRDALDEMFHGEVFFVKKINAESRVGAQPMSDEQSMTGALNRATQCWRYMESCAGPPFLGIGIEGGLQRLGGRWYDKGWVCVKSAHGTFYGSTINMEVPAKIMDLILTGTVGELGDACDIVFNQENSKQGIGHFGLMTDGVLNRTRAYRDAVIAALGAYQQRLKGVT